MSSRLRVRYAVYTLSVLLLFISCYFTTYTLKAVYDSVTQSNNRIRARSRSNSLQRNRSSSNLKSAAAQAQQTLVWTVVSTSFYWLALLNNVIWYTKAFIDLYWNPNHSARKVDRNTETNWTVKWAPYFGISHLCNLVSYVALFLVCFRRLTIVFDNTPFMISKRIKDFIHGLIALSTMLILCTFPASVWLGPTASAVFVAPLIIIYPSASYWIAYRFWKNTTGLCFNLDRNDAKSMEILNTALRLSVVTFFAVLSSSVFLGSWVMFLIIWEKHNRIKLWIDALLGIAWPMDSLCNQISLYMMMSQGKPVYFALFGSLHNYLLNYIHSGFDYNHQ